MISTVSKKLLTLSLLAFVLIATTFTLAKNDERNGDGNEHWPKNSSWSYLSGNYGSWKENHGSWKQNLSKVLTSWQILCVRSAVEKRETSIVASETVFQAAILSGLNVRKTNLLNAWSLTTKQEIKSAVKKAWKAYEVIKKDAKNILRKWEKSAWKIYNADIKVCKVNIGDMEKESEDSIKTID